jgi:type II secretory pathway pseudopilin PulG
MRTKNQLSQRIQASRQQGYALLTMVLLATLLAIAAAAAAPSLAFRVRYEREEELIHRGAEYRRAIRAFTRKYGRYPTRVEELENTNGIRFLRRRYKDPITGQEFKLLHIADVQFTFGPSTVGMIQAVPSTPDHGTEKPKPDEEQAQPTDGAQDAAAADDSSNAQPEAAVDPKNGAAIVGVASTSKRRSIREFKAKDHYNQWLFFYDPAADSVAAFRGPTQPGSINAPSRGNNLPGVPGTRLPVQQGSPTSDQDQ